MLDTIKSLPARVVAAPVLFETAFIKGPTQKNNKVLNLYGITIGKIKIVSGQIIACDPGHIDEYSIPFIQAFPTGEFPVQLSIVKVDAEEIIAFARVKFNDERLKSGNLPCRKDSLRYLLEVKKNTDTLSTSE